MMRLSFPLALLLLLGAAPQEKKKPKSEEVARKYAAFMAEMNKESKAIGKDLDAGDAAVKARLQAIRRNAEAASKLDYWKGEEEEVGKFKTMFEIFLDIRLKSFLDATWTKDSGEKLYERLQGACRTCHELFRD